MAGSLFLVTGHSSFYAPDSYCMFAYSKFAYYMQTYYKHNYYVNDENIAYGRLASG
jgi:hypothetical protein